MNGNIDNEATPQLDMKTRAITWLLMQGLGVVVLVVLAWTQHSSIQEKDRQILELTQTSQANNKELTIVLTEVKTLLADIKYQTRITDIRRK